MFSRETQDTRAHEWLKQLASADFRGGQWLLADPDAARRTTMAAWDEALDELYDDACVSVGVFNDHRAGKDRMSVLASREQDRSEGRVEEILIMLSGRQVRLFRHGGGLVTKATVRRPCPWPRPRSVRLFPRPMVLVASCGGWINVF
jgi:hypothetical protein